MKIRELRAERKQAEVAEAIGIDVALMSKVENGRALLPPKKREMLCKVLGCRISDLYAIEELIGQAELEDYKVVIRHGSVKITKRGNNPRTLHVNLPRADYKWLKPIVWQSCGYLTLSEYIRFCLDELYRRFQAKEKANVSVGIGVPAPIDSIAQKKKVSKGL